MTVEIKRRITGEILHTHNGDSLAGANLSGADLRYADLTGADISGARASPRADWPTLFGMVIDAEAAAGGGE